MSLEVTVERLVALSQRLIKKKGMIFPTLKKEVPSNLQVVSIRLQGVTFLKTLQPIIARCNANREGNGLRSVKMNQPRRETPKLWY